MHTKWRAQDWQTLKHDGVEWSVPTRKLDMDRMNDWALRKPQPSRSPIRSEGVKNVAKDGWKCAGAWVLRRCADGLMWVVGGMYAIADRVGGRGES